jgi:protein-disulfide isomerase
MHPRVRPALSLLLLAFACTPQPAQPVGKGPQRSGRHFDPAPAPVATAETPAAPAPTPTDAAPVPALPAGTHPCDAARLRLAPDMVVATLDGKDVLASELGKEVDQTEAQAQRTYCDTIAKIREGALENLVDERLIDKAAAGDNMDGKQWFRAEVDKLVEEPNEGEVAAFYEQNKSEDTPPLDVVREQVVAEIVRSRQQSAAQRVLDRLRKKSEYTAKLPDVRLPPPDLGDAESTPGFGPKDAAVHVVEFSDFECPYCARAAAPIEELKKKYGDRVRFSFRHFPLSFHPNARPAAEAAQCAEAQGKFWAFHDAVFARSSELGGGGVRAAAEDAGLDLAKLDACLASGDAAQQVDADLALASEAGVSGTPSFFLDGRQFEGGPSDLGDAIEAALQKQG